MSAELDFAIEIARRAGGLLADRFADRGSLGAYDKSPRNLVTQADIDAERMIRGAVAERFPGHAFVGEEFEKTAGQEVCWYVDPLDGTTNFAFGIPHWCTSIGACDDAGELLGVIFDPLRNELYSAERGAGAHLNGIRLSIRTDRRLDDALLATGFASMRGEAPENDCLRRFAAAAIASRGVRRMGSAALDLAYVAAGRFDIFFEEGLSPWDTVAGAVIVRESGGVVLDYDERGSAGHGMRYAESGRVIAGAPGLVDKFRAEVFGV